MKTLLDIISTDKKPLVNIEQSGFVLYPHIGETIVFSDNSTAKVVDVRHIFIDNTARVQVIVEEKK